MTSTADARREAARGNGVGQAGQFGHQAHSAPSAFDPGTAAPTAEPPTSVNAWAEALAEKLRADKSNDWSDELAQLDAARAHEGTKEGAGDKAQESFRKLLEVDPAEGYATYQGFEHDIKSAEYPRLGFRPAAPDDEESYAAFIDRYTGAECEIRAVDIAERWTTFDGFEYVEIDPDDPSIGFDYDGEAQFEGLVYQSENSDKPVRLPEGWRER